MEVVNMDDIARFGAHLSNEKHASQNTVSSYLRDTTQFAEYLHNHYGKGLREADSGANPPRPLPGFWLPSNPFTAT